jgi:hypothetical protein
MADKLPIDLPAATAGQKMVHAVNINDFTDGPSGTSQKVHVNDASVESVMLLVLDTSLTELQRQVTLTGTVDNNISVNMSHISIAKLAGSVSIGTGISVNTVNGTFNVLKDLEFIEITVMARALFANADNIVLGIGVGDPTDLPILAGTQTVGGTYVSRFIDAHRGEGANREVTFQLPYFPVGRAASLAASSGDELFLVGWTEETDDATVTFNDIIFTTRSQSAD